MGWGRGPYGLNQWGAGGLADLRLENAQAIAENLVRLTFNTAPLYTGVLGPNDASNAARYNIVPVAGTAENGADPRNVRVIAATLAEVEGAGGSAIDITLDRPMSGYPAEYLVSVNQMVVAATGGLLEAGFTSFSFLALEAYAPPHVREEQVPSRDIANPQTRAAALASLLPSDDQAFLGTIPVDERGDYAFDQGITNLRKRVLRRLVTGKGRFTHLPEYGVGLLSQLKRLSLQGTRREIAADAEAQISREPEVEQVSVTVVNDPRVPSLLRLRVKVRASKLSDDDIDMNIPFSPTET